MQKRTIVVAGLSLLAVVGCKDKEPPVVYQAIPVVQRVMELYDKEDYDNASTKRAIARFCMRAVKSAPEATDAETPPHVLQAKQFLAQLRIRDPNVMRQAEQFFFQQ